MAPFDVYLRAQAHARAFHPGYPRPITDWLTERARNGGADEIPLPRGPGRLWLCGKHYVGPDPDGALARSGANVVVCLCEPHEIEERYPAYVAWLRTSDHAVWFPIPDLHAPAIADAVIFTKEICTRLDDGDRLLMHCGAGIGRAGTMAAAILIARGVTADAALATVAAHRPMAGPEAGAQRELIDSLAWNSAPSKR